ncbi:MAG: hypothetical protein KAH25_12075 [Bacteroidales bacterium]|nr:hypothetical protein [Bacteroidales bacterium]
MENKALKIPIWFWIVAIFFLLWNLMGVYSFFVHIFISADDLAKLPPQERELYGDYPLWTSIVFALAVFGGLLGSIGLVMKRRWAKTAFIISLLAIIPQMIHNVFFTKSMEVYGPGQAATMPIMVVVLGVFLVWFSAYGIKKSWLT